MGPALLTHHKKKDDNDLAFLLDIPKTFSCFAKITRVPFVLNSPASTSFSIPFFEIFERTNLLWLVFQLAATWSHSHSPWCSRCLGKSSCNHFVGIIVGSRTDLESPSTIVIFSPFGSLRIWGGKTNVIHSPFGSFRDAVGRFGNYIRGFLVKNT